jgi:hypothetical protein
MDPEIEEKKIKPVIRALPGLIFTTHAKAMGNTGAQKTAKRIIAIKYRSVA